MIESTNLFTEASGRPSRDINDDLDDDNLINPDLDENLNQMTREFEEKQLTAPQKLKSQTDEPQTENDLIAVLQDMNRRLNLSTIVAYWKMGQMINSYYKGKYGSNELQRIADGTTVGKDTLTKACKFARNYSEDQLTALLNGNFYLSWSQIAQNLSVEPQKLISVYQEVRNPSEFHNGIMKLKDPGETRGKAVKKDKTGENVRISAAAQSKVLPESGVFNDTEEEPSLGDEVIEVMAEPENQEVDQVYESYRLELESTKAENAELKAKIEELQATYQKLEMDFNECDKKRVWLEKIGKAYLSLVQQILRSAEEGMAPNVLYQQLQKEKIVPFMTGEIFNE